MSCECEQTGLGALGALLPGGATFRQGFVLSPDYTLGEAEVIDEIEGCLYSTGMFDLVRATFTSGVFDHYYLIEGTTAFEFGRTEDLTGLIIESLKTCVVVVGDASRITHVDPLQIDSIPASAIGQPGVQQPTTGAGSAQQPDPSRCPPGYYYAGFWSGCKSIVTEPPKPGECDWEKLGFVDALACELDIKPATAGILGAAGALLAVVLLVAAVKR